MATTIPSFPMEDFIPEYPSRDDPSFALKLAKKKEFQELNIGPGPGQKIDGVLYASQIFSRRMFSPYTEYTKAAFFHQAGAGKTCEASAIIEGIRSGRITEDKRALIFVNNETLVSRFEEEIAKKCAKGLYDIEEGSEKATKRRLRKEVSKYYEIVTQSYINTLMSQPPEKVKETHSGRTVILDEVHTVTETTLSKKKREKAVQGGVLDEVTYHKFKEFLHLLDGSIVIIMTGSPIWDKPDGFATLMNLILPLEDQLPKNMSLVSEDRLREVLKGRVSFLRKAEDIKKIEMGITQPLTEMVRVYPSAWSEFQETVADQAASSITDQTIAELSMVDDGEGDEDDEATEPTTGKGKAKPKGVGTLGSSAIAASTMVYPKITSKGIVSATEGIYKTKDFLTLINTTNKPGMVKYRKGEVRGERGIILKKVYSEIEQNLIRYSAKFSTIIENIIKNPRHVTFVYCDSVKGVGGVFSLGLCLQIYGLQWNTAYTREGLLKSTSRKFTVITGSTNSEDSLQSSDQIQKFLDVHNSVENKYGDLSQVIIGSKVLRLGLTIKHTRKVHIAIPHWNVSSNNQVESRAIRLEALDAFPPEERIVEVYLHTAVRAGKERIVIDDEGRLVSIAVDQRRPKGGVSKGGVSGERRPKGGVPKGGPEGGKLPIDLRIMVIAEEKVRASAPIYRIIQQVSYDCVAMYRRNVLVTDEDGSAECNYGECNYQCDGIPPLSKEDRKGKVWSYARVIGDLDYSTYNLFYGDERKKEMIDVIIAAFGIKNQYSYQELKALVKVKEYEEALFILAVDILVNSRMGVVNRMGMRSYIKIAGDHIFLDSEIANAGIKGYSLVEYTNHYLVTDKYSFEDQILDMELKKDLELIDQVCDNPNKRLIKKLSVSTRIKLAEEVWIASRTRKPKPGSLAALIKKLYSEYFMDLDGRTAHVLYHVFQPKVGEYSKNREKFEAVGLTRVTNSKGEFTSVSDKKEEEAVLRKFDQRRIGKRKSLADESPYGLYGVWNTREKVLKIIKSGGTGRNCSSFKIWELSGMMMKDVKFHWIFPRGTGEDPTSTIFEGSDFAQINHLIEIIDRKGEEELKRAIMGEKGGDTFSDYISTANLDQLKTLYFFLTVSINKNHAAPLCRYFRWLLEDAGLLVIE